MAKKELKNEQLNNVNGGAQLDEIDSISCSHCGFVFEWTQAESRTVDSGCSTTAEHKCPKCGQWTK